MKSRRFIISAVCTALLAGAAACSQQEEKADPGSEKLFREQLRLYNKFMKELKAANDTTSVDSLSQLYESELTRINMSYPEEANLGLSEGQNDTLYMMSENYAKLMRMKKDPNALKTDTIKNHEDE